jgi:tetratricopeptide (TPR) repeat protein
VLRLIATKTDELTICALQQEDIQPEEYKKADDVYWQCLKDYFTQSIQKHGHLSPQTCDPKYRSLDFGLLDAGVLAVNHPDTNALKIALRNPSEQDSMEPRSSYTICRWIHKYHQQVLNPPALHKLQHALQKLTQQQAEHQEQLLTAQQQRRTIFQEALEHSLSKKSQDITLAIVEAMAQFELCKENDDLLFEKWKTKYLSASGVFLTTEDRRNASELEEKIESQTKRIDALISELQNSQAQAQIESVQKNIHTQIQSLASLHCKIITHTQELENTKASSQKHTPDYILQLLLAEIDSLQKMAQLTAKRLHKQAISVLHGHIPIQTQVNIQSFIDYIERYDPRLFQNGWCARNGKPFVFLLPGVGNGLFDMDRNVLFIPVMAPETKEVSILHAIVDYKLCTDEDKHLLLSYQNCKPNRTTKGSWALRNSFIKHYRDWILKESHGYKVFNKYIREWFHREIAPKKRSLIVPKGYNTYGMSSQARNQYHATIYQKATQNHCAESWFILGILEAELEHITQATSCFKSCLKIAPRCADAYYNLAQLYLLQNQEVIAKACFTKYIQLEPNGWYTAICREHLKPTQDRA